MSRQLVKYLGQTCGRVSLEVDREQVRIGLAPAGGWSINQSITFKVHGEPAGVSWDLAQKAWCTRGLVHAGLVVPCAAHGLCCGSLRHAGAGRECACAARGACCARRRRLRLGRQLLKPLPLLLLLLLLGLHGQAAAGQHAQRVQHMSLLLSRAARRHHTLLCTPWLSIAPPRSVFRPPERCGTWVGLPASAFSRPASSHNVAAPDGGFAAAATAVAAVAAGLSKPEQRRWRLGQQSARPGWRLSAAGWP